MQATETSAPSNWRDSLFVGYWSARTISLLGTGVTTVVLPILVYQATGSPFLTSLLTAFQVVPYLVFGLAAGVLADRVDRLRLMIACDLACAVLVATIPLAAALGFRNVTHAMVVALAIATAFVWFDAANFGAVPAIVGRERVVTAMSAVWASNTAASVVGPLVAGGLLAWIGVTQSLSFDALSYFVSAIILIAVRGRLLHSDRADALRGTATDSPTRRSVRSEMAEGLQFIWHNRLVRSITASSLGVSIAGGATTGLLVVYASQAFGSGTESGKVAFLFAAAAAGEMLASLTLPRLSKRFRAGQISLAGLAVNFVALICVAVSPSFWPTLVPMIIYEFAYAVVTLNGIVLRQVVTPAALVSRVSTSARIIGWGGRPLGATFGGLLAAGIPVRWVLITASAIPFVALVWGLRSVLLSSPVITGRKETFEEPVANAA